MEPKEYYQGERGSEYYARQHQAGVYAGEWSAILWKGFTSNTDDVLDFGCGGGFVLASLPSRRKMGIEVNPLAADIARRNGLEIFSELSEIPTESVDKVISNHALEHVASPLEALTKIRNVLRPSGKLLLILPLEDWRVSRNKVFEENDPDKHLYAWTPRVLGNLFYTAGFKPERIRVVTYCTLPRFGTQIWDFSPTLFRYLGYLTAFLLKRRQLVALAVKS